ncbi:GntR family transcriptional regulator [Paenibacillus sp. MCAF20]
MIKKTALYKQIQQQIREKIISGRLRPSDRIPSEQELMDEFKVSKITVKNALTELADEGLVTRIQGKGTFVAADVKLAGTSSMRIAAPNALPLIGFTIPTMKTRVIQKLVDYMEFHLKEAGFQMILSITRESAAEESKSIRVSLDKFPFVFIDRYLRNIETYTITSDNLGGAYDTVSYLLGKGHRHIALISPENANTAVEDRTTGVEKAYIDQEISIDKNLWCHVPLDILRSDRALAYITDFLQGHKSITAAFTLTEEIAQLTSQALQSIEGQTNVELISFDDPGIPNVAYVQQDEREMARAAVSLLRDQIMHAYAPQSVVVSVQLIFP